MGNYRQTVCGALTAVLLTLGSALAQTAAPRITLDVKGGTLADTLKIIAREAQTDFIIDPRVDQTAKVTASLADRPLADALKVLLAQVGNLTAELVEGVWVVKPAPAAPTDPRTTLNPPPPPAPVDPTVRSRLKPTFATPEPPVTTPLRGGVPTVEVKASVKLINLHYGYAPGLAVLLANKQTGVRGQALLYSQIDPWAGALGGGGLGQSGNANGGPFGPAGGTGPGFGGATGLGGGLGFTGAGTGRGVGNSNRFQPLGGHTGGFGG